MKMIIDEMIKESSSKIPEMNPNLKEIILENSEKSKKRPNLFKNRLKISLITCSLVILLTISGILVGNGIKNNSKKEGEIKSTGISSYVYGKKVSDEYYIEGEVTGKSDYGRYFSAGKSVGDGYPDPGSEEFDNSQEIYLSGTLTVSACFDYDSYDYWKTLLISGQDEESTGLFFSYHKDFSFKSSNRYKVEVPKGVTAKASLLNSKDEVVFTQVADRNGIIYLYYDKDDNYKVKINYYNSENQLMSFTEDISSDKDYKENTDLLSALNVHKDIIELMFIIDTTGSMSDELNYIAKEIDSVISGIKDENANTEIRLAIMLYRDTEDEYLTDYSDFTTDIATQKAYLRNAYSQGGGDFEEAVEKAFSEAVSKNWSNEDTTKIIIHVADAPAHDNKISSLSNSILECASKGIRVITVGASGIDKKTEYFMRSESLLTGGIYTFLTNDSGIGGEHLEATTKEKLEVELLNSCLIRLVNGLHTGEFKEAVNYKQDTRLNTK